jgi:predicted enzyme related to lactoylglutathione lyase
MIHYPPGTPLWVDLVSSDIDASVAFYSNLFGWQVSSAVQGDGYRTFSSEGKVVCGIMPKLAGYLSPQWITYISTNDLIQTVSMARAAGGKTLMETDQDEARGMMILQDPEDTVFGIFQDNLFAGAQMFNRPVSLTFNLLMTRQPNVGKRFYSEVFGWDPRDRDLGFAFTYFFQRERGVAGLMAMNEQWQQSVSSHWQVSFAIEDADALVTRAIALGGKAQPPITTPFGRSALITDPHGATFSLSQQTPEVRAASQTPAGVLAHLV